VFRRLALQKESRIEEVHLMPDHVHMMISIPPKYAVSQVVGFIKGKSAIHLARTYGERKRNFVGQNFWARGYFVLTVGRDEAAIREYIKNQEQEDKRLDQLNLGAHGRLGNQGRGCPAGEALMRPSVHESVPGPTRPSPDHPGTALSGPSCRRVVCRTSEFPLDRLDSKNLRDTNTSSPLRRGAQTVPALSDLPVPLRHMSLTLRRWMMSRQ
jgi:putative transposase